MLTRSNNLKWRDTEMEEEKKKDNVFVWAAYRFCRQLCLRLQKQHTLIHCPHSTEGVGSSFND